MNNNQTLKDIADAAGVSVASVSRVVSGKSVRQATRDKVLAQIAKSGYTPNLAARSLRTKSNRMIACAVRGLLNPPFSPVLQAIEQVARANGYRLLLTTVDEDPEAQRSAIGQLRAQGVDGLIFAGSSGQNADVVTGLGLPVVILDRDPQGLDTVNVAHAQGIREAVLYLAALGHERIGLCAPPASILPGRERIEALLQVTKELGLPDPTPYIRDGCMNLQTSFVAASEILGSPCKPTALIAGGMSVLPGTLRAIRVAGLEVGRDLSLIAGCDSELAELSTPSVTAVRWDLFEWGSIAARLLLERISNNDGPESFVCLPVELVSRHSCAPLIK